MAARKLASEIDRTLKKVSEGVEVFDGIFEKIHSSTNQAQKEKLEQDLKSQIKKLQRLRDQIKTWMQSNDIKDKQPLIDNRKLIETQMERFKAIEKEMKTKAFSKEGLSAAAKLDPREQQKHELCHWITTMVDELSRQVEQTDAEIETLQLAKKKKDVERSQRLEELEGLNDRRNWHVGRLELILRLLENGNLLTEAVAGLKEDIAYFVESNTEEDFEYDEGIYDELNLQEEEDLFALGQDDLQSSHGGDSASLADLERDSTFSVPPTPNISHQPLPPPQPTQPRTTPSKQPSISLVDPSPPPSLPPTTPTKPPPTSTIDLPSPPPSLPKPKPSLPPTTPLPRKQTLDSSTPRTPIPPTPTRSISSSGGPQQSLTATTPTGGKVLPPIRYAAAAAAANVSAPPPGLQGKLSESPEISQATIPTTVQPVEREKEVTAEKEVEVVAVPVEVVAVPVVVPVVVPTTTTELLNTSLGGQEGSSPALSSRSLNVSAPQTSASTTTSSPSLQSQEVPLQTTAAAVVPRLPTSLADLVTSFESAKQKSMKRDSDLGGLNKALEIGFANVPLGVDAEKPKYYVPRNPFATPSYYPQEPSSQFANPALFAKFDVDTLFYIFYYCQGTYLQYLAAQELKKQSWRFHKQYLTWFQRANEPQQITEEFEQGVYLYFDWEGSWCQRRKSDFRFEYRFLSSD